MVVLFHGISLFGMWGCQDERGILLEITEMPLVQSSGVSATMAKLLGETISRVELNQ